MKGLCHYLPNILRNLATDCFQHSENYVMVCVLGANWTLRLTPLTLKASLLCPQLKRQGLQKGGWVCMYNRYILLLKIATLCCLLLLFHLCQDFSPMTFILQKVLGP